MEFLSPIFDLCSDYLPVNQGQPTATRLSALVEGKLSHDAITRSLHQQNYDSRHLWQVVKPFVHQIAQADADTFTYIDGLERHFIMPIKANRKVALSQLDRQQGRYQSI